MKLVFAIIVTYNASKWVEKCFGSLINSSIPVNIIAIDNASTDGTPEYIRKHFPEVDLIQNQENLGFGLANNIGIRKAYDAGADYVFLLNQDAWVEKDTIEKLVKVAEKNPEFGIISPVHLNGKGDALDVNFSEYLSPKNCPYIISDLFLRKLKDIPYRVEYVNAAAWLISRKCIQTVGGFNPLFFLYGEDDNYQQRVRYHNLKIGIYPLTNIFHDRMEWDGKIDVTEEDQVFFRRYLAKHLSPLANTETKEEKLILFKGIIKNLFLLNFSEIYGHIKRLKLINNLNRPILEGKALSKEKGLTFLTKPFLNLASDEFK